MNLKKTSEKAKTSPSVIFQYQDSMKKKITYKIFLIYKIFLFSQFEMCFKYLKYLSE